MCGREKVIEEACGKRIRGKRRVAFLHGLLTGLTMASHGWPGSSKGCPGKEVRCLGFPKTTRFLLVIIIYSALLSACLWFSFPHREMEHDRSTDLCYGTCQKVHELSAVPCMNMAQVPKHVYFLR